MKELVAVAARLSGRVASGLLSACVYTEDQQRIPRSLRTRALRAKGFATGAAGTVAHRSGHHRYGVNVITPILCALLCREHPIWHRAFSSLVRTPYAR